MAGNRSSKSRTSRQSHGLKFGMVGTYNTYFRNIKRQGKVIFYHGTTLTFRHIYQTPLQLSRISYASRCNTSRTLPCKSENLRAMGGEEHLRSARTVRSAQAASWPMVLPHSASASARFCG